MTNKRRIFFISSSLNPVADSGGGSIVIYRHLKRFKQEGYEVIFVNGSPVKRVNNAFEQINLSKKFWHPPLRKFTPLLTKIRAIIQRASLNNINFRKGDILISLLEDPLSYTTLLIAKKNKIPFYLFFHDDNIFNRYFEKNILTKNQIQQVIKHCEQIFVVSEPMQNALVENGAKNVSVVYPIPQGEVSGQQVSTNKDGKFNLAISGMLLPYFFENTIEKIRQAIADTATELYLIGAFEEDYKRKIQGLSNVSVYDRFDKLNDLFTFLKANVDVIIVFYSADIAMEIRSEFSFPSKFVEFTHLGIPILIIAPQQSAIGKWCIQKQWLSYIDNTLELDLLPMINKLKDPEFNAKCLAQCSYFAKNDFNPSTIHNRLVQLINADE